MRKEIIIPILKFWDYGLPARISDTELEYGLPGGEKRIYELK